MANSEATSAPENTIGATLRNLRRLVLITITAVFGSASCATGPSGKMAAVGKMESARTPVPPPPLVCPAPVPGSMVGWVPCATQGETCSLPPGAVTILYGGTPDPAGGNITVSFAPGASVLCDRTAFGQSPNLVPWNPNFCWYQGSFVPPLPSGPITGPAITLPIVSPAFPGSVRARIQPTAVSPNPDQDVGAFRDSCGFSKFSFSDPLDHDGASAYLSVFFGNTAVSASSTSDSIQSTGGSTCGGGTLNRSAYWVPAMIDTSTHAVVRPGSNNVYYKTGFGGISPALVQPVPPGLVMVAGSADNTAERGNPVRYSCPGDARHEGWTPAIPTCSAGSDLVMEVTFKQCWDGVHLDSPDHADHMADPVNGACPDGHSTPIPQVTYNIHYPVPVDGATATYQLSSDNYDVSGGRAGYSGHGSYIYGWDTPTFQTITTLCLNTSSDCHDYLLGNGMSLF